MYGGQRQNIWNLMYEGVGRHHSTGCSPSLLCDWQCQGSQSRTHSDRAINRNSNNVLDKNIPVKRQTDRQTDLYVAIILRCKADREQSGIYWLQYGAPSTATYNYGSPTWHFVFDEISCWLKRVSMLQALWVNKYEHNLMFFWPCIMNWLYINYQLDALIIIYS